MSLKTHSPHSCHNGTILLCVQDVEIHEVCSGNTAGHLHTSHNPNPDPNHCGKAGRVLNLQYEQAWGEAVKCVSLHMQTHEVRDSWDCSLLHE